MNQLARYFLSQEEFNKLPEDQKLAYLEDLTKRLAEWRERMKIQPHSTPDQTGNSKR